MSDVLVIGSGAGGVHAAWRLVERGLRVRLLDYGNVDGTYEGTIPGRPWSDLRRSDEGQHRYFLGERFEGIPFGGVRVGAQLTPPRQFIPADTERLTPVDSRTFSVTESLARGGLASGWGAGVFPFLDRDLEQTPLSAALLAPHCEAVAERIGVCGGRDDLHGFLGECPSMMPALDVDSGAARVLEKYGQRRAALNAEGFFLGKTRLAVSSREHRGRGPHRYLDMDFWADDEKSVYRPRWTLEELQARDGFEYLDRRLVRSFTEGPQGVEVRCRHADTGTEEAHTARAVVLAAGAIGSARIALRSLERYDHAVPILCNPYTYVPLLNLGMLGREASDRRHSLAQLTAFWRSDPRGGRVVQAQYYSYRSLLLYKLLKESPLAYRESLRLMRLLQPLLGILGIHHEDRTTGAKTCVLRRGAAGQPDRLEIEYALEKAETRRQRRDERGLLAFFRRLGCWPLTRVEPGHGANIHYAGTLPFSTEERELTCEASGLLRGTRAVYVADGAVFPYLPAKGLTFTIMANADRVGSQLAEELA